MAVKYSFELQGDKVLTDMFYTSTWAVKGKTDRQLSSVVVSDGDIPISISKVGNLSKIIAYSTSAVIKITTVVGVTTTILEMPVNGLFVWEVPTSFSSTITNISVSTTSTQVVDIDISVIGL